MQLEHEFTAPAGIAEVWPLLLDVEQVAPCLPGADVIERTGEHSYDVAMKISMGPMRMRYVGQIAITEIDADGHRAVMTASAKEARGQGTATAAITITLAEEGATTRVVLATNLNLTGRVAQMGRGMVEQVASEMLREFAACLGAKVEREPAANGRATTGPMAQSGPAEAAPRPRGLNPLKLLLRSLLARLRRRFRKADGP